MSDPTKQDGEATLQGTVASLTDADARREALDRAFDYRGDVTIRTADGRTIEGYVFDRRRAGVNGDEPCIRIMPADGSGRLTIRDAEVTSLAFTGRDPAAGKSWETWLKKYAEKKLRGEAANLEPDPLE